MTLIESLDYNKLIDLLENIPIFPISIKFINMFVGYKNWIINTIMK